MTPPTMSRDESKREDRDLWADPRSSESNTLCVPNDIPFPTNTQTILEESRKASGNPNIMSWKEVACAGPGDESSKRKDDIASKLEGSTLEDKQSGAQVRTTNPMKGAGNKVLSCMV